MANPKVVQDYRVCKFFRCNAGKMAAIQAVRDAASGRTSWELKRVHDPKTGRVDRMPILEATTYSQSPFHEEPIVVKSGFITPQREWVIYHDGQLQKTGQMMDVTDSKVVDMQVKRGLARSGI